MKMFQIKVVCNNNISPPIKQFKSPNIKQDVDVELSRLDQLVLAIRWHRSFIGNHSSASSARRETFPVADEHRLVYVSRIHIHIYVYIYTYIHYAPYVYVYYSHDYSISPLACHAHDRRGRGRRVKLSRRSPSSTEYLNKSLCVLKHIHVRIRNAHGRNFPASPSSRAGNRWLREENRERLRGREREGERERAREIERKRERGLLCWNVCLCADAAYSLLTWWWWWILTWNVEFRARWWMRGGLGRSTAHFPLLPLPLPLSTESESEYTDVDVRKHGCTVRPSVRPFIRELSRAARQTARQRLYRDTCHVSPRDRTVSEFEYIVRPSPL